MASRNRPNTTQGDLANLPPALQPLTKRPQWTGWRWAQNGKGKWQKPPCVATDPQRRASITDPSTWCDYSTAVAAWQAGDVDGITYILTADDPYGAVDLDHCLDQNASIDKWAQNFLQAAHASYQEVTPSGEGVRIWGVANGDPLHTNYRLEIDGKTIGAELFRRTNKPLTITGKQINAVSSLTNIDPVIDWGRAWAERHKAAAAEQKAALNSSDTFESNGSKYSLDEIERIVREGPPAGADRSAVFHTIVGHFVGCGWDADRIFEHLQQHPDGIGSRYIAGDRLLREVMRSAGKFAKQELPQPEAPTQKEAPPWEGDSNFDEPAPDSDDDLNTEGLDEPIPEPDPGLPQMHIHGQVDNRPLKSWLIKGVLPEIGHGLLSGQWSTGKTVAAMDLAGSCMSGQPFLGRRIKRQCGVLFIAAESGGDVRIRFEALLREKYASMSPAPFIWYETAPKLLHKGSFEKWIAMARQADQALQTNFGLPLGLIIADAVTSAAGFTRAGDDLNNAVGQAIMDLFKVLANDRKCFVLAIDHFGKDQMLGTRGPSSKEDAAEIVLACLGNRQIDGTVLNTRLAIRKNKGGEQGQSFPYTLRKVTLGVDEDGDPETSIVVDWLPPGSAQAPLPPDDPWAKPKRQDQRTAVQRLKRVLMAVLAEQGVDLPITPDGPVVRMVDQKLVRQAFYAGTPAEGETPQQTAEFRRKRYIRAIDWAEDEELIGISEIDGNTYLWLQPKSQNTEDPEG
jgi:hypothetical protein